MSDEIVIPEEIRERLKRPLGLLVRGCPENTSEVVRSVVRKSAGMIVAVGDAVTKTLLSIGLKPDVCIVDGKIERRPVEPVVIDGAMELSCENRPGTISGQAYKTVVEALGMCGPVIVRVDGEEDLLGLVVMAEAPLNTLMLYGQPREGVVIVHIDEEVRKFARGLIEVSSRR
ncbi:hypothetical protein HRbin02_01920 [Candidatus Calditenuaceae archaeon HR02]|nr:hypothetical protein HRbin02_01920 [Candidatus Calditenuaceae archaeon HR02]